MSRVHPPIVVVYFFYLMYASLEISRAEISRPFSRDCTVEPSSLAFVRMDAALLLSPTTSSMPLLRHLAFQAGLVDRQAQRPMPRSSAREANA